MDVTQGTEKGVETIPAWVSNPIASVCLGSELFAKMPGGSDGSCLSPAIFVPWRTMDHGADP